MQVVLVEQPSAEDRAAILAGLVGFNRQVAPTAAASHVAIAVKNEAGDTVGGLWGTIAYDWLAVELLFVPEELRGRRLGSDLIGQAETLARERGCRGLWLDTFSFQARGFYEKLGYSLFGEVEDHPLGGARYFLKKVLGSP